MRRFGWMRLTALLLVLTVLVVLARLGDPGAEARSLADEIPDTWTTTNAPEPLAAPEAMLLTDDVTSSLENMRGSVGNMRGSVGGQGAAREAAGPPPPVVPATAEKGQAQSATARKAATSAAAPSADAPPVFYRPPGVGADVGSGPVCGDLGGLPGSSRIVFPLEREFFYSYEDTWGAARPQGGHEGTDLMTPFGVPEYAMTDGTVVPVAGSDAGGWNTLGGHAVMVRADYSIGPVEKGDLFYYAHLERRSPLKIGTRVRAGQVVGYSGDTGQGPPGTRGLFPPHLHLGWYDVSGTREDADSGAMNPYPLLEWVKANGGAVSGGSDARFCEAPSPGPPTPSSSTGPWPTPTNPGVSPDLDTGSNDPKPVRANAVRDREVDRPAEKPSRTARPERDREETPSKRPDGDRPQAPAHQRPDRPNTDPQGPPRPAPGGGPQPPPKPEPPKPEPPEPEPPAMVPHEPVPPGPSQYDPSTGESNGPTERHSPRPKPGAERKPTADENTDGDQSSNVHR